MLACALDAITTHLTVGRVGPQQYQASLHMGGNSYRVRVAATASEAVREVLGVGEAVIPPPPY